MPATGFPRTRGSFFAGPQAARLFVLLGAALLLASWGLSHRVTGYEFLALGDDDINVTLNPYLGHLDRDRWVWLFTDSSYVRRFMPFGWMTLFGLFQVNGLDPAVYHAAAFAFYLLNVALVYAVVAHALRVFAPGASQGLTPWQVFTTFLAAAWWALHPLRVESTAWISGLLYGQAAFFALCATLCYLRSYMHGGVPRGRVLWTFVSLLAISASLMTYPIALGFVFAAFAMDVFCRHAHNAVSLGRLAAEKLLFLAPIAVILTITARARMQNPEIWGRVPTFEQFPLLDRVMQAAYVVGYYAWRPLYPLWWPPITSTLLGFNPWSPVFLLSLGGMVAVLAYAAICSRSKPWLWMVCVVYLAVVVPFIGFTEHPHYASDRYAYLPTVVMASALAAALCAIRRAGPRGLAAVCVLGIVCVLGTTTDRVLGIWSGPRAMFTSLVGSIPEGEEHDRIASRFAMFEYLYGDPADARATIERCVHDFPASAEILKVQSQIDGTSGRLAPDGERMPIAFMHSQLGLYFLRKHQADEAAEQLRMALAFDPTLFEADYNLAVLEATHERPREALHHFLLAAVFGRGNLSQAQRTTCLRLIQDAAHSVGDSTLEVILLRRRPL